MDTLNLTQEWDKKFPQSNKVNHRKVTLQKPLWHHTCRRLVRTQEYRK